MIHLASRNSSSQLSLFEEQDVQPNAIDLRLDQIFEIHGVQFSISEDSKVHRGSTKLEPATDGYFYLEPGVYEILMKGNVHIGPDEAGWVITRSTLNRNGLFITSGLYDSGYHGVMAGALHVHGGPARLQRGVRVAQFLLFKAEALSSYDGDYGLNKQHDKKYG